jgi:hypothetical protein
MTETKAQAELARVQRVVEALRQTGSVSGHRLAACPDVSDIDLRRLAKRAGDDPKLSGAAWNAIRLRRKAASGAVVEVAPDASPAEGTSGGDRLPVLRAGDAIVRRLDGDHVLVLGNTELGLQFGDHVRDLSPALARRATDAVGGLFAASATGLQAASAVQSISQAGAVFVVAKASRHLLAEPLAMTSEGALGWVRPGGSGIAHLRFARASTGLRTLSSITGLVFTLSVIAGQARMDRTLGQICLVLDDVKEMARDQQVTEISVAGQLIVKVLAAAEKSGELSPGLVEMLPSRQQLMENVDRSAREVARLQRRLDALPSKAGEKLKVLEATVPDMLLGLGLYAEAERTLSAAEALYRYDMSQRGDVAVPALTEIETEQRETRLIAGAKLAVDLEEALTFVEADPGAGWFSSSKRDRVRVLARQVRADLPTLGPRALAAEPAV